MWLLNYFAYCNSKTVVPREEKFHIGPAIQLHTLYMSSRIHCRPAFAKALFLTRTMLANCEISIKNLRFCCKLNQRYSFLTREGSDISHRIDISHSMSRTVFELHVQFEYPNKDTDKKLTSFSIFFRFSVSFTTICTAKNSSWPPTLQSYTLISRLKRLLCEYITGKMYIFLFEVENSERVRYKCRLHLELVFRGDKLTLL